ncbi:MAG: superoxide dismutase, partial [Candidatus Eremiobacteraeota bacterium]|nr:superoxide dismutase [Candidatus Eremiobacteraeota bacterium]
ASSYGTFELWKKDLFAVGSMRGVGWAIAYCDPQTRRVSNTWIGLHEEGHLAGCVPIVVMDCWEHAFMLDYKASERAKYVEAFFTNLNWDACDARFTTAMTPATTA